MKRVLLLGVLALLFVGAFAQKLDKAKDKLKEGKLEDARTEIEAFLAQEKNAKNADAWYIKAKVYNAIAAADPSKAAQARVEAYNSLKKYFEYDDKLLISLQIDKYEPLNSIYQAYFKQGADNYNAKNYEAAYEGFKHAIEVSKFMIDKKLLDSKLDTSATLYAGVSAENLSKPDEAAVYYSALANIKIKNYVGSELSGIYRWLTKYYSDKKDYATANTYVTLGRELYPNDPFWPVIEIEMAKENPDKQMVFKKYEELIQRYPDSPSYRFNYAVELYNYAYDTSSGKRPANSNELIEKAYSNAMQVTKSQPDYAAAQLFTGQIIYNQGVDLLNEAKKVKGSKPEDIKKRNDLKAQAITKFDEAAPYLLQVDKLLGGQGKLKVDDKRMLKDAYDILITINDQKNLKDKVKEFEVKFNDVDRVH